MTITSRRSAAPKATHKMYAAGSYGNSEESEILKAGVDVNARSKLGETALMASAATGKADEALLQAGADVNAVNDVGMTALMLLVQCGDADEIAILLRAGANPRKKDVRALPKSQPSVVNRTQ